MKPTREQARVEKGLRDMGVTVTFTPSSAYPHDCDPPNPRCFRCQMEQSAARTNGADR